jgi:hypothetical protein
MPPHLQPTHLALLLHGQLSYQHNLTHSNPIKLNQNIQVHHMISTVAGKPNVIKIVLHCKSSERRF